MYSKTLSIRCYFTKGELNCTVKNQFRERLLVILIGKTNPPNPTN